MPGSTSGVHEASAHPRRASRARLLVGLALASTVVGSLAAAPAAASTTTPGSASTTTLTTTTIDKPWYSVEQFYLGLVNCTRTGGWVQSDGSCRGYGSGRFSKYVAPLTYSVGISDKVSRPYAKRLAVNNLCSHYAYGDPGYRLRKAGYTHYTWGENIGCRNGYTNVKAAVLASHIAMQHEKWANGGHWRNIKNANYRYVGIGIWRYSGRVRVVTDFYR